MTTLAAFRQQHPEYGDMSDADLAGALRRKYYGDMPEAKFNQMVGFAPKPATPAKPKPPPSMLDQGLQAGGRLIAQGEKAVSDWWNTGSVLDKPRGLSDLVTGKPSRGGGAAAIPGDVLTATGHRFMGNLREGLKHEFSIPKTPQELAGRALEIANPVFSPTAGAAAGMALSPVGGTAEAVTHAVAPKHAKAIGDITEAVLPIPNIEAATAAKAGSRLGELGARVAEEGIKGAELGTPAAERVIRSRAIPKAQEAPPPHPGTGVSPEAGTAASINRYGSGGPILEPGKPEERITETQARLDDGLNRLRKSNTADEAMGRKFIKQAPREIANPATQQRLYTAIDERIAKPGAPTPDDLAPAEAHLAPWKEAENEEAKAIINHGIDPTDDAWVHDLPTGKEGYVRRIVQGKGSYLDALDPKQEANPVMGGRPMGQGGLSRTAPSLKPRQFWVLENPEGERVWFGKRPEAHEVRAADKGELKSRELTERERMLAGDEDRDFKEGQTITKDGRTYTVKRATTAEIESKVPGLKYHKNALVNTVENVLRLRRVRRNLDFLESMKADLKDRDLAVRTEYHRPNAAGEMVLQKGDEAPEHFKGVDIPQLKGWKFDPKIADTLNDFYKARPDQGIGQLLQRVNRFLVGTMFFNPLVHIENVGAHWIVGRGWDWMTPQGWISLVADGRRAINAVVSQNEDYRAMLREGSGLIYGDVANDNFYKLMLEKMGHDMMSDPQTWGGIARDLGFGGKRFDPVRATQNLVHQLYRASNKTLWAVNDMFLLQRQFELMRKGMPIREAIAHAERDIPNYRVPTQVLGQRWLRQALTDPNISAFGRYKYGMWRALLTPLKDVVKGSPKEKFDAIGKLVVLTMFAFGVKPFADKALQAATGNNAASVRGPGPFGPISAMQDWQAGERDWQTFMSSIVTPAPGSTAVIDMVRNRDFFGRKMVEDEASPMGKTIEGAEAVSGLFYPGELAQEMGRPGGAGQAAGQLVGLKLPPPGTKARREAAKAREKGSAARREARDPIEQKAKGAMKAIMDTLGAQ